MAICSSILAWRIPWTEEPGGLQSGVAKSQTQLNDSHYHWPCLIRCLLPGSTRSALSGHELQESRAMTWWPWGQRCPESCPMSFVHFTSEKETQSHMASK